MKTIQLINRSAILIILSLFILISKTEYLPRRKQKDEIFLYDDVSVIHPDMMSQDSVNFHTDVSSSINQKDSSKERNLKAQGEKTLQGVALLSEEDNNHTRNLATVTATYLWNFDYREDDYHWIIVRIARTYTLSNRNIIITSLKSLARRSGAIRFNFIFNRPPEGTAHIHIHDSFDGCFSHLGRTLEAQSTNGQPINMSKKTCMNSATIQHEMMHALGFGHEQSRLDRNEHITIMWDNIITSALRNFYKIAEVNSLGTPYDLDSIMHYRSIEWSNGNGPTIVPKYGKVIGNRKTASPMDIIQIRLMYQCKSGPRNFQNYEANLCSADCKCSKLQQGCRNRDSFCKGNLVCTQNTCQSKSSIPDNGNGNNNGNNNGNGQTVIRKNLVKPRIVGKRYLMVPGVMFDIKTNASPIIVTNLIFKGLGLPDTKEDVEVDIYTKQYSHRNWVTSGSDTEGDITIMWRLIGSATLRDNGTNRRQYFPSNSFSPVQINSNSRQSFYIQVKNCSNCNKLRVYKGSNYSDKDKPFVQDKNAKILKGCILHSKFSNRWGTCRSEEGGTSYTFWGGFQYSLTQ